MSLAALETPKKAYLSTAKLPGLPKPGLGRLLGKIIAAYAAAVSISYGTAMGLGQNRSEHTGLAPDRDY